MQKINLYKYVEDDGSTTITPIKRNESDIPYKERLVVDDGRILTNRIDETPCVDISFDEESNWIEIDVEPNE